MFRCALLMCVLCGSLCRTVFVYLTTRSMKYKGLRVFFCLFGFGVFRVWVFLGGGACLLIGFSFCLP